LFCRCPAPPASGFYFDEAVRGWLLVTHLEEALEGVDVAAGGGGGGEGGGRGALECLKEDGTVLVVQGIGFAKVGGEIDGDSFVLLMRLFVGVGGNE